MKFYFELQFNRINRILIDAGIRPFWGWILGIGGLILVGSILYSNTNYASFILTAIGAQVIWMGSDKAKVDFLSQSFGEKQSRYLRLIEGHLIGILFLLLLIFHHNHLEAAALWIFILLASISGRPKGRQFVLQTPFYAYPFEFSVGFRKTVLGFMLIVGLVIIAIVLDNPQIGLFALMVIFLICMHFYSIPENEFFIWIYCLSPSQFLWHKVRIAILYSTLLAVPVMTSIGLYDLQLIKFLILVYLAGLTLLSTIVVAKYAAFPRPIQIPEGVLIAIGISFPPLLLLLFPYFYKKAIQKLKFYLNDNHQRTT